MIACAVQESATTKLSFNYLRYNDPFECGESIDFYGGGDCQMMELDAVSTNVRGTATRRVTRNKATGELCQVGLTRGTPDLAQATVRMKELCGAGLPAHEFLKRCAFYTIVTHGECRSSGNFLTGWTDYVESYCLEYVSDSLGRRSSYEGLEDERIVEITADILTRNVYAPVIFSPIELNEACVAGNLSAVDADFACNTGCGDIVCGCQRSCDDGTQSFYIPMSCDGGANHLLAYSTNGGATIENLVLPAANDGGTVHPEPKVAVIGSTLYVLVYQNPTELWAIQLDDYNVPTGGWTHISTLFGDDGLITTGEPAELIRHGGDLHILVKDTVAGSRTYFLNSSGTATPDDGERETFTIASEVEEMDVCGKTIIVGGLAGSLFVSRDKGATYATLNTPTANDITSIKINNPDYWVGDSAGGFFHSSDQGATWNQVSIVGATGEVSDIDFIDRSTAWMANADGGLYSTWTGGKSSGFWTNSAPRLDNWPDDFTPISITTPQCTSQHLLDNTVLVIGENGAGETQAYIGRAEYVGLS